jgi:signal transduction histidine kinase/DNA-binding NarL/FixJ family response regulator/HPt (histidine-containing phosphotransfer) domain-containing protein
MRRTAAQQAVDTGDPVMTKAITLVQDQNQGVGVLMYLPVYAQGAIMLTVQERRASLVGLLYAPIVLHELLEGVNAVTASRLDFELHQAAPDSTFLFTTNQHQPQAGMAQAEAKEPRFVSSQPVLLAGRELTLRMTSTPEFEANIDHTSSWLVLASGALISALLVFYFFNITERKKKAAELVIAHEELASKNDEKNKQATQLFIAIEELAFANEEKSKQVAELVITHEELAFQNDEKDKRALELIIANKELAFQNEEKGKRAAELVVANEELTYQNAQIKDIDPFLVNMLGYSYEELAFENEEKDKRASELVIANKELAFQNEEKDKRALELVIANKELAFQNEEKDKRASELVILTYQHEEKGKRAEELKATMELANAANSAKSAFLATMSHEIRTPLGGLMGMLELLSFSKLDNEQAETLQSAYDAGSSLLRILNDILDFSKIDQGKLELAVQPVSIAALVADVAKTYSHLASGKSVAISHWVDSRLSQAHMVDPLRLSQVLNNFVSNAIKFSHGGKVGISAELLKQQDGAEQLRFSVKDDGIGMMPEVQQRLFMSYEQGSADTARMFGGTGLGLSICRRLADLMDAQIEVRSAPAQGSTFTITLTLAIAPASALLHSYEAPRQWTSRPQPLPVAPDAPQVLVVDDNSMNRKVMARQLALLGFRSDCAENGEEALAKWRAGSFALVITDCHMPVMDGYALTRAIRAAEADQALPRTSVFAWTANALPEEIDKCYAAEMDELLVKPITIAQLQTVADKWLSGAVIAPPSIIAVDDVSLSPLALTEAQHDILPELPRWARRYASRNDEKMSLSAPHQAAKLPSLDVSVLAALVGDEPATLLEFLHDFGLSAKAIGAELLAACAAGDVARVGAQAHKLKSSASAMGAMALSALCDELEVAELGDLCALTQRFKARMATVDAAMIELSADLDAVSVHGG